MRYNHLFISLIITAVTLVNLNACGYTESSSSSTSDDDGSDTATAQTSNVAVDFTTGSGSTSNLSAAVTVSDDYCVEASENEPTGSETQSCTATPENYNLGILAIYLVDCVDADGVSVACSSDDFASVGSRTAIYNGDQVDTVISAEGDDFDGEFTDIEGTVNVGGVQVVTAYVEQNFPASGDEADKVMEDLQGKAYRICLTDENLVDEDTMETRCGLSDARKGDYLVDLDGDGVFGYIDNVTADSLEEVSTRPADYNNFNDDHFASNQVCFRDEGGDCSDEYTSETFYGVANYFAPIMSLSEVATLDQDALTAVTVTLDITDTFLWTDGADSELADADTCVGEISDECVQGSFDDSDSGSVGVYNIFYDTAFLPQVPTITVEVDDATTTE